jgi:hypothetical protein
VNFFGAVATLETLRPLLAQSRAPPAVAVSSFAALTEVDPGLLSAFPARTRSGRSKSLSASSTATGDT